MLIYDAVKEYSSNERWKKFTLKKAKIVENA